MKGMTEGRHDDGVTFCAKSRNDLLISLRTKWKRLHFKLKYLTSLCFPKTYFSPSPLLSVKCSLPFINNQENSTKYQHIIQVQFKVADAYMAFLIILCVLKASSR